MKELVSKNLEKGSVNNRLHVITLPGFRNAFNTVSERGSKALLFNPLDERYGISKNQLTYNGLCLSVHQSIELLTDPNVNKPLEEPLLVIALWSYLMDKYDLRNGTEFLIGKSEFSRYFGISEGTKGFNLITKLETLTGVFGFISSLGFYKLLDFERCGDHLKVKSDYMHTLLKRLLDESIDEDAGTRFYYTDKVHASLLSEKNKVRALIVIEITKLLVTSARKTKKPKIALKTLIQRIPLLYKVWKSNQSFGNKNRQLRRAFQDLEEVLSSKTELYEDFEDLKIELPKLSVSDPNAVISINHSGYLKERK
jgi:hypothetical protein